MVSEPEKAAGAEFEQTLIEIERTAVDVARLAGAQILSALGGMMSVRYKGDEAAQASMRDPVSEVDHRVEVLIRALLAERFAEHDIIGEEMDERPGRDHDFVWALDPIDGTTNFINGFPLFCASIGVLHRGRPVVGALWCTTSHAVRSGVYHAREGGPLCFDEEAIDHRANPQVMRRLGGDPDCPEDSVPWDVRRTGSAALECAFVAAGLLRVARFKPLNIWDVAGGAALGRAAGCEVRVRGPNGWEPLERFEPQTGPAGAEPDLRYWRRALVMGDADAVEIVCGREAS